MPKADAQVEAYFTRLVEGAGYRLVRLKLTGTAQPTLQVMAERPDGTMDVEDCARLSGLLSDAIELEDPIGGDYLLEVSSPGIDRPLTRIADFVRWAGFDAKIELVAPVGGRKRFKGVVKGAAGDEIVVAVGKDEVRLPFSAVAEAKLLLTDALIAADQAARDRRASHTAFTSNAPSATGD